MEATTQKAKVPCPRCNVETEVDVPELACLTAYECDGCHEINMVPPSSPYCCVVCEFTKGNCPFPANHRKA